MFDPGINAFSIATKIFPGGLFVQKAELSFPRTPRLRSPPTSRSTAPKLMARSTASLDWRRTEGEEWTITVETSDGTSVRLEDGGARLILNGETSADNGIGEYPDIYRTFVDLIDERRSLVDVAPLRLVADCLLVGGRKVVEAVNG